MELQYTKDIKELLTLKNFSNFWECFEYLKLAGYQEYECLTLSCEHFNGEMWFGVVGLLLNYEAEEESDVINDNGIMDDIITNNQYVYTTTNDCIGEKIVVTICYMNNNGNPNFKEIYQAYLGIREYELNLELENQLSFVTFEAETELLSNLLKKEKEKHD